MTITTETADLTRALRRAAVRGTRAPSVHNTQPWRWVLRPGALELHADRSRQLRVLDPRGRQLVLSCGSALFNARSAMAWLGYRSTVERFPDAARPDFVARVRADGGHRHEDDALALLDCAIDGRRTNRREFSDEAVPAEFVETLIGAAEIEGAQASAVENRDDRLAVARLSQLADGIENTDPAYRAELRAWTTNDPQRRDGVPSPAVPHVDAGAQDDVPIRDFDTQGAGWLPTRTRSSMNQCLLILGAQEDVPAAWLRTGEALERILLEISLAGYAASPLTQAIEIARTNAMLREELRLAMHPHVLLRIGRAAATPETRRRRLVDVLTETE